MLCTQNNSVGNKKDEKSVSEAIKFYNNTSRCCRSNGQEVYCEVRITKMASANILQYSRLSCNKCMDSVQRNNWGKYIKKQKLFQLAEELSGKHEDSLELEYLNNLLKSPENLNIRKTCQIGLCNENKSANICARCQNYVCGKCTFKKLLICKNCRT